MIGIKDIKIEFSAGVVSASGAFLLSFFTGLISGVKWTDIMIRSAGFAFLFAVIGAAFIVVMKKYVPEMFEFFFAGLSGADSSDENSVSAEGVNTEDSGVQAGEEESPDKYGFQELEGEELASLAGTANPGTGRLGKHIVKEDESFNKYEPKLLAEAVRTMMRKDGD